MKRKYLKNLVFGTLATAMTIGIIPLNTIAAISENSNETKTYANYYDIKNLTVTLHQEGDDLSKNIDISQLPYENENREIVYFTYIPSNMRPFLRMSDRTIAEANAKGSGLSEKIINSLSKENIEILSNARSATITRTFFEEKFNGYDYELVEIEKGDFFLEENNYNNFEKEVNDYMQQLILIGDYNNFSPFQTIRNVGGGRLELQTVLIHSPTQTWPGRYLAFTQFIWNTMPTHRGTDILGILRGQGYTLLENGFEAVTYHLRREYIIQATSSSAFSVFDRENWIRNSNFSNQVGASQGVAIRINQPNNSWPSSIFPNTSTRGFINHALQGWVSYVGTLSTLQPGTFNLSHFGSYSHQTGTSWFGSPSVSVSSSGISLSLSVTPTAQFAPAVEHTNTLAWSIR